MKAKQFLRRLRAAGVEVVPDQGKGGHYGLKFAGRRSTLSFHSGMDLGRHYLKEICKQLGLDWRDIL